MANNVKPLAGLSILIVEDEAVIAMLLEEGLEDSGCNDIALVPNVGGALSSIKQRAFSGVLLDMNLHGVNSTVVAEELVRRSIPFALVTGYGVQDSDPQIIKSAPRLQKPFTRNDLLRVVTEVFVNGSSPSNRHGAETGG